jgi:hypothetical protein
MFGQMWVRCNICRRYARLKLAGLLDIDYRKKVQRLTVALNNPEDRAEAAEAIGSLVDKISLLARCSSIAHRHLSLGASR